MKQVTLDCVFPEFPPGRAKHIVRGQGTSIPTAVARAFRELIRQKGVRRRQYSTINITMSVSDTGSGKKRIAGAAAATQTEDRSEYQAYEKNCKRQVIVPVTYTAWLNGDR